MPKSKSKPEPEPEENNKAKKTDNGDNENGLENIGYVKPREICEEMKESYIDYAMSVIVSRALPDVRDGLKPVHRRILYAMGEEGLYYNARFRKSATVVGAVLGRYHPHSDAAVYDSLVRMAQDFSLRYMLVKGQGNFGSIDADPPAAQRYTECRLSRAGQEMLRDINRDTVDFIDNYDSTRKEPTVLPSPLPQLLLNGSLGIAVGMATSIPPHNLVETCDAAIHLIDNPEATTEELFQFIKGPDFPTGGIIFNQKEIISAYAQGKGPVLVQGKADIVEEKNGGWKIVINEIPYQVNKATLVGQIAKLIQEKKIKGVKDARDESDRDGIRIVIELKKEAFPQKALNCLYKSTDLQKKFHLNMIALVDGIQPKVLSLSEMLGYFLKHRQEVVLRRTKFDLTKAKEREHILLGLAKCLAKIDQVIETIKKSKNRDDAKSNLKKKFQLTDIQAEAILETKLSALARLEIQKIEDELKEIKAKIEELSGIVKSPAKVKAVVKKELKELKETYPEPRRTKVYVKKAEEISEEDLVPEEEVLITLTNKGYIKRVSPSSYKIQKRGGKGIMGIKAQDDDFVEHFFLANTLDKILVFTDSGKVFAMPAYEIPSATRISKGRALVNFLEISQEDKVLAILPLGKKDDSEQMKYLVMATKNGIIKRTALEEFRNLRSSGLIAIRLKKGDSLRSVKKTSGKSETILVSKQAQSIRFKEEQIRPMQRSAAGNKGMNLKKGDEVIGMEAIEKDQVKDYILIITSKGYGKRSGVSSYRQQSRGGTGIMTAKLTAKTGDLVKAEIVKGDEELIFISRNGQVLRTTAKGISALGRATQGVRIMRLDEGDSVVSLIKL
ncbi:DNA gyrase subunit A [Patescibacteria group bacterium]|nr:DNA gyrase subunit A [Patescibacteria group bacterium]MBU4162280.1 DNA gyrase subunit A [Patescibacteria group bacterium]